MKLARFSRTVWENNNHKRRSFGVGSLKKQQPQKTTLEPHRVVSCPILSSVSSCLVPSPSEGATDVSDAMRQENQGKYGVCRRGDPYFPLSLHACFSLTSRGVMRLRPEGSGCHWLENRQCTTVWAHRHYARTWTIPSPRELSPQRIYHILPDSIFLFCFVL